MKLEYNDNILWSDGQFLAEINKNWIGEEIVKRVNLYDELIESLKEVRSWYEVNQHQYLGYWTPACFSKLLSVIQKADDQLQGEVNPQNSVKEETKNNI